MNFLANKLRGGMGQQPMQGQPNSPLARSLLGGIGGQRQPPSGDFATPLSEIPTEQPFTAPPAGSMGSQTPMGMPGPMGAPAPQTTPFAPPPTSNAGTRAPQGPWVPPQQNAVTPAADDGPEQGMFTGGHISALQNAAQQANWGNQRQPDMSGVFSSDGNGMYTLNQGAIPGNISAPYDASRQTPDEWAQYAARQLRNVDESR